MRTLKFVRRIELSAPPDRVWALLADTDRLNREIGFPLPTFTYQERENGGTDAFAALKMGGIVFRYREHPFEWVKERFYSVRRTFDSGPIAEVIGKVEFEGTDDRTTLIVTTDVVCRYVPAFAKIFGLTTLAQLESGCKGFEQFLTGKSATPYARETGRPPADPSRLEKGLTALIASGTPTGIAQAFCDFLVSAPTADLVNFRPLEVAAHLGIEPSAFLDLCLTATRAGLIDLKWRVMCPYCRSNKDTVENLGQLGQEAHCVACNIRFGPGFDENVEVVFSVSYNVRPVVYGTYCIGGPLLSPHAVAQWVLEPGEERRVGLDLPLGVWQIASLQAENRTRLLVSQNGTSHCQVRFRDGKIEADSESIAGQAHFKLVNETGGRVVARIEEAHWSAGVVTAAKVTSLQKFRDLFSSEVLSPGIEIGVGRVCILFTDLKGSTRMYREQGDASSYATVREHFSQLKTIISRNHGAIVKTIGDAIMASFHDPGNGLRAALEIQASDDPLVTKIGMHWGPAIVVNANEILDYFGRTVNLAARLQKHSLGGDVVVFSGLLDDPGVSAVIAEAGASVENFTAEVPDIEREMKLVRLTPLE